MSAAPISIVPGTTVLVVGAGIMGAGIAQVAAQAGHSVLLFDAREGAAAAAHQKLAGTLDQLSAKGKLSPQQVADTLARIQPIGALAEAVGATLAIEVIVEQVQAKRDLLQQLEAVLGEQAILASNTSSISVTALANGLQRPERLVGMHFFNPVPLMKLVEVVSGLCTDPAVAEAVFALAAAWGKVPVHARSTPGFIVNRIARPYYAETLALLQQNAAEPAVLDACLRGAGFRMGPCELMDLIGHDTNFAVTQSVYEANFFDKRFVPSLVQRALVDGGLLGRKSGRGFFRYDGTAPAGAADEPGLPSPALGELVVHGQGPLADRLVAALSAEGWDFARQPDSDWCGLAVGSAQLRQTDGRCAAALGQDIAVVDWVLPRAGSGAAEALAWAASGAASSAWQAEVPRWLHWLGFVPQRVADMPGLVVARTVAMLVNEAADAVQQGVCDAEGADLAMKLGVNYPAGPFEWLADVGVAAAVRVLQALDAHERGERYRVSPWLQQAAWREAAHG